MAFVRAILVALLVPLLLTGCLLTPGKFVSRLTIDADRTFSFSYQGDVIALDPNDQLSGGMGGSAARAAGGKIKPPPSGIADENDDASEGGGAKSLKPMFGDIEAKRRAVAEGLSKEAGYRSVVYRGDGVFRVDYAISGTLTHGFVFPFNSDAEAVVPFVTVELRGRDTIRVRAPQFANNGGQGNTLGMLAGQASRALDGRFTLDTDAEIVAQNNEDGPVTLGPRREIAWRVNPLTREAPSAALRVRP